MEGCLQAPSNSRLLSGEYAEFEPLHNGIGQQLLTSFVDELFRFLPRSGFYVQGNVLTDANIGQLTQPDVGQIVGDCLSLRVEQSGKRENVDGRVEYHFRCHLLVPNRCAIAPNNGYEIKASTPPKGPNPMLTDPTARSQTPLIASHRLS